MVYRIPGVYLSNNYLFWDEEAVDGKPVDGMPVDGTPVDAALIDAAAEPAVVAEKLAKFNLRLKYIILTHGHYDHVACLPELMRAFPEAKAVCMEAENETLADPAANVSRLFVRDISYPPLRDVIRDGEVLRLGNGEGGELRVISTPGHTPGSCCLYNSKSRIMFTGDCLFADGGYGRVDFPGGSMRLMAESLHKLAQYPGDVTIYPGHEGISTIGMELGGAL